MKYIYASLFLLTLQGHAYSLEWLPVGRITASGGQGYFENKNTSFNGNADWLFTPTLRFSTKLLLIPTLSGQYRRTREVRELAGGGFLSQNLLDNSISVKSVHKLSQTWSIKPFVSFKNEMLAESKNEKLSKGLFNFNKLTLGIGTERKGEKLQSFRQDLSVFSTRFYNFKSLASQQRGEEINSGKKTLDFNAVEYDLSADIMLSPGAILSASALFCYQQYLDQNLVTLAGTFKNTKRQDTNLSFQLGYQQQLPRATNGKFWKKLNSMFGLTTAYSRNDSNQNNYDAGRTRFNPKYYNYTEVSVSPSFNFLFLNKLSAGVSYEFQHRLYDERPVQDKSGNYTFDVISQDYNTISWDISYPIYKGLSVTATGAHLKSSSNMKFEQAYRYNYTSSHYFVGARFTF